MISGVRLVDYGPEHDAATVCWLASDDMRSTFGFRGPISVASHRRWVDCARATRLWAVIDPQGQHCGNTLLHLNERHRSGYFQMYIGEPAQRGRGIGAAALQLTLAQAFGPLDLHRVWLHTLPDNAVAETLYGKHGFVLEGVERDSILADGVYLSQRRWSLLATEWAPS